MKRYLALVSIFILISTCSFAAPEIRPSMFAGSWYPKEKSKLLGMINKFLSQADVPKINGKIKEIIVPHAGYIYSGGIAAYAYKAIRIQGYDYKRVIMIGPCHRAFFYGVSVNLQKGYETPLGIVSVDQEFGKRLLKESSKIHYIPMAHAFEHSLEIELPFLQAVLNKGFKIVPILMGSQDIETSKELADAIVNLLKDDPYREKTLILASSDLSHYYTYDQAKKMDSILIEDVKKMDPEALNRDTLSRRCEACGKGAIMTVLFIARKMGIKKSIILKYANSGDVTGDYSRVVGYMSAVLVK